MLTYLTGIYIFIIVIIISNVTVMINIIIGTIIILTTNNVSHYSFICFHGCFHLILLLLFLLIVIIQPSDAALSDRCSPSATFSKE